jgi:pimeloyl-ACP methyl ester carboxylesterase
VIGEAAGSLPDTESKKPVTLRAPPKPPHATASLVGRFVGLLVLLALFAVVVWVAATNQQVRALERSDPLIDAPGEHLTVNGQVLHVRTFGRGDEVTLIVHDDNIAGGALVVRLAEALAEEGRRVVVPDMVGFGLSSRPPDPGRIYSSIGQAETLATYLGGAELGAVEVVGVGSGGVVAADLAVIEPPLVSRLVLVDVPSLTLPATGWQSLEAMPFGVGQAVSYTREGAALGAEEIFRETCPGPADCGDPEVVEAFRRSASVPGTAASIRARRASAVASVAADRVDGLEVPMLIVSTTDAGAVSELVEVLGDVPVQIADDVASVAALILAG